MIVLKDDLNLRQFGIEPAEEQKSFMEKYMIINPKTSRYYIFWETIFFFVMICQFLIVPYT